MNLLVKNASANLLEKNKARTKAQALFHELVPLIKNGFYFQTEKNRDYGSGLSCSISPHPNVDCGIHVRWSDYEDSDLVTLSISVRIPPKLINSFETRPGSYGQTLVIYQLDALTNETAQDIASLLEAGGFRIK